MPHSPPAAAPIRDGDATRWSLHATALGVHDDERTPRAGRSKQPSALIEPRSETDGAGRARLGLVPWCLRRPRGRRPILRQLLLSTGLALARIRVLAEARPSGAAQPDRPLRRQAAETPAEFPDDGGAKPRLRALPA